MSAAGAATMSGVDATFVGAMEAVAARSVPAAEVREVSGWMARCSPGLATKRVNSVWPRAHDRYPELEAKLALAERFYSRGVPARHQISPASQPSGLERVLLRPKFHRGNFDLDQA